MLITTQSKSHYKHTLIVMMITLFTCLFIQAIYLHGPRNFNQFFLPAEMFGVPKELQEHGIKELYKGPTESGWDGQFYFYIANDPLAKKDTLKHIDSSAYRYQRIGLPLLAKINAKIIGGNWVSPLTYYLTSLIIILLASGAAATFFQRRNWNPYIILFWSLGCGTQITQLNGLPDAAADGFLIMALISLATNKRIFFILTSTFAALSREAYILLPLFMLLVSLIKQFKLEGIKPLFFNITKMLNTLKELIPYCIPIFTFAAWHLFIQYKFGITPSSQATNILGWPLASALHYFNLGAHGSHPVVGTGTMAYLEAAGIAFYLGLLLISAKTLFSLLINSIKNPLENTNLISIGIACTFLTLIAMYFCFGSTVMMHYTGYFKAANLFLFIIPLTLCLNHKKLGHATFLYLLSTTIFFNHSLWTYISAPPYHPTPTVHYANTEPNCLIDYQAKILPISIEVNSNNDLFHQLFSKQNATVTVQFTNLSNQVFSPYIGKGSVNISYQWINAINKKVVMDGVRTTLTHSLNPKESIILPIYLNFPKEPGQYLLTFSAVQEGCSWFYIANPKSAYIIPYNILG